MADNSGYMLSWGDPGGANFAWQVGSAAYQKLTRQDAWRWVTQERIANDPAEQYVGRGSKTIQLDGVIFTSYNPGAALGGTGFTSGIGAVGTKVLDKLRQIADAGTPYQMVDGRGNLLGKWVLTDMKVDEEYFLVNGAPQKQTFSLSFRYYADDGEGGYLNYSDTSSTTTSDGTTDGGTQDGAGFSSGAASGSDTTSTTDGGTQTGSGFSPGAASGADTTGATANAPPAPIVSSDPSTQAPTSSGFSSGAASGNDTLVFGRDTGGGIITPPSDVGTGNAFSSGAASGADSLQTAGVANLPPKPAITFSGDRI